MPRKRKPLTRPPTDNELCGLAAAAMLMHDVAAPTATASQRVAWQCSMHLFLNQLGVSRRDAGLLNEVIYQHRYKGYSLADALPAARKQLSKPRDQWWT